MSDDDTAAAGDPPAPEPEDHGGPEPGGRGWGLTTAAQAIGWATLVAAVGLWLRLPAAGGWFSSAPMTRRYGDYRSGFTSTVTLLYSTAGSGSDPLFVAAVLIAPAAAAGLVLARRARRLGPGSGTRSATVTAVLALVLCAVLLAAAVVVPALAGLSFH